MNLGTHHLVGTGRNHQACWSIKEGNGSYGIGQVITGGRRGAGWILAVKTGRLSYKEIQRGEALVDCSLEENPTTRCEIGGILECLSVISRIRASGTMNASGVVLQISGTGRFPEMVTVQTINPPHSGRCQRWRSPRNQDNHVKAVKPKDLMGETTSTTRKGTPGH